MKTSHKWLFGAAAFLLVGQGCLGLGSGSNTSDGSVWRSNDAGESWQQLVTLPEPNGSSSIAGVNVTSIEIDPSDLSTFYMGTEANGLFYTHDSGSSWSRPEHPDMRNGYIVDVEVDPNNVCSVYVMRKKALYHTGDCMRSFQVVYSEVREDVSLSDLVLDWYSTNVLYIGTTGADVIKSSDNASSWTNMLRAADGIHEIMLSNRDSRVVLVGTDDKGLRRSPDGGVTWVNMEDELLKQFPNSDEVYGFAQTKDGTTILMNTGAGILRSTDFGLTWSKLLILAPPGDAHIWDVEIDVEDEKTIYYATVGALYVSNNGGESWVTQELPTSRAPKVVRVHPTAKTNLLMGVAAIE